MGATEIMLFWSPIPAIPADTLNEGLKISTADFQGSSFRFVRKCECILSHTFCKTAIVMSDVTCVVAPELFPRGQVAKGDHYHHLEPRLRIPGIVHSLLSCVGNEQRDIFSFIFNNKNIRNVSPKDASMHFSKCSGLKYKRSKKKLYKYIYFYR